jgi:hypothetical protein
MMKFIIIIIIIIKHLAPKPWYVLQFIVYTSPTWVVGMLLPTLFGKG